MNSPSFVCYHLYTRLYHMFVELRWSLTGGSSLFFPDRYSSLLILWTSLPTFLSHPQWFWEWKKTEECEPYHKDSQKRARSLGLSSLLLGLFVRTLSFVFCGYLSFASPRSLCVHSLYSRISGNDQRTWYSHTKYSIQQVEGTFRLQSLPAGYSSCFPVELVLRKSSFSFLYFYLVLNTRRPFRYSM